VQQLYYSAVVTQTRLNLHVPPYSPLSVARHTTL
jgi:hypothetical protein